jgi:hypothetical protein
MDRKTWRAIRLLEVVAVVSLFLAGCSGTPTSDPSVDTLVSAIRAVGYPCASVIDSSEFRNGRTSWRVACQNAFVYTTNVSDDGRICITPVFYGDFPGNAAVQTTEEHCVSVSDT